MTPAELAAHIRDEANWRKLCAQQGLPISPTIAILIDAADAEMVARALEGKPISQQQPPPQPCRQTL